MSGIAQHVKRVPKEKKTDRIQCSRFIFSLHTVIGSLKMEKNLTSTFARFFAPVYFSICNLSNVSLQMAGGVCFKVG